MVNKIQSTSLAPLSYSNLNIEQKENLNDVGDWLPIVAHNYKISKNINDYLFFPVVLLISDIPDSNGLAFPKKELFKFIRYRKTEEGNIPINQIAYQTWCKTGVFYNHKNDNDEEALGVVFDVSLLPFKCEKTCLYKVLALIGIDTTKDKKLTERIKNGEINTFSQGSCYDDLVCSICGCSMVENPNGCIHLAPYLTEEWKVKSFNVNGEKKLAYWIIKEPIGKEISIVDAPAYWCAQSDVKLIND